MHKSIRQIFVRPIVSSEVHRRHIFTEYTLPVFLCQLRPEQTVVGVYECLQRICEDVHRRRRVQFVGLVRDERMVRYLLLEPVRQFGDVLVVARQYRYVAVSRPIGDKREYLFLHQGVAHVLVGLVLVRSQEGYVDQTMRLFAIRTLLADKVLGVYLLDDTALFVAVFLEKQPRHGGCGGEKTVVEVHDIGLRTVVDIQFVEFHILVFQVFVGTYIVKKSPVTVPPSVDTLLHIAHNEVLRPLMRHAFEQQFLEILPLYGTRVLKFINHDVLYPASDFLEHERRIGIFHQFIQQVLRLVEKETVCLTVYFTHFPVYVIEQPQFVYVLQNCPCRRHIAHTSLAFGLCLVQVRHERTFGKSPYRLCGIGFFDPSVNTLGSLLRPVVKHQSVALVNVFPLLQFGKICRRASLSTVCKIIRSIPGIVYHAEEPVSQTFHALVSLLYNLAQRPLVEFKKVVLALQFAVQCLGIVLVFTLEDFLSEILYVAYDIPVFVVLHLLLYVTDNPFQRTVVLFQLRYEFVDSHFLHLIVVQFNAEICIQFQFMCQIAQHTLEKGVYGLYIEVGIVVQYETESHARLAPHLLFRTAEVTRNALHIVPRISQAVGKAIQLTEYAQFHFLRCLVGERHCQRLPVGIRIGNQQFYKPHGKGKCLAGAGTRTVDSQCVIISHSSPKVLKTHGSLKQTTLFNLLLCRLHPPPHRPSSDRPTLLAISQHLSYNSMIPFLQRYNIPLATPQHPSYNAIISLLRLHNTFLATL